MSGHLTIDAAAGYTDLEDSPISRDERFYAGTPAQTDILTDGRAHGQRVLVVALGGRLSFSPRHSGESRNPWTPALDRNPPVPAFMAPGSSPG